MGRQLVRIVLMIVQWVVVPVGLVVVGYYVVGPRLGTTEAATSKSSEATSPVEPDGNETDSKVSRKFAAPKVQVTVRKGSSLTDRDLRMPTIKKKKPVEVKAVPDGPKTPVPTVDPDPPAHHEAGEGDGGTGQETIPIGGNAG